MVLCSAILQSAENMKSMLQTKVGNSDAGAKLPGRWGDRDLWFYGRIYKCSEDSVLRSQPPNARR